MDAAVQPFVSSLSALRKEIRSVVEGLEGEVLNWSPLPGEANGVAVLVHHVCGSESLRAHQLIGGIDVHRDRPSEFKATAQRAQELLALLDRTEQRSSQVLEKLTARDLERTVQPPGGAASITVQQCLVQIIEHTAIHVGHLQLTRQLLDRRGKG